MAIANVMYLTDRLFQGDYRVLSLRNRTRVGHDIMRTLVVDAFQSMDRDALEFFRVRGHHIDTAGCALEAIDLVHENEFDCIFLDVETVGDALELADVRALSRTSAIVLMATSPVESLVADSLSMGHLEFPMMSALIANLQNLVQPALIVAAEFAPRVTKAIKDQGFRALSATTLQLAMNVMADGWCQIVCLSAKIPGPIESGHVALVRHIGAREMAILASALPEAGGIRFTVKPRNPGTFLTLMRSVAESRPSPCGLTENFANFRNTGR